MQPPDQSRWPSNRYVDKLREYMQHKLDGDEEFEMSFGMFDLAARYSATLDDSFKVVPSVEGFVFCKRCDDVTRSHHLWGDGEIEIITMVGCKVTSREKVDFACSCPMLGEFKVVGSSCKIHGLPEIDWD